MRLSEQLLQIEQYGFQNQWLPLMGKRLLSTNFVITLYLIGVKPQYCWSIQTQYEGCSYFQTGLVWIILYQKNVVDSRYI